MGVVLAVVGARASRGRGVALVGAGPVGMIAGAAAGILLALVGKSGMEKALVKAKLPLLVRKLVTDNAVKRGLSRQREEIEKAIIKALADPANGFPRGCARAVADAWRADGTDGQGRRNVDLCVMNRISAK